MNLLWTKQKHKIKYDVIIHHKSSFSKTFQFIWIVAGKGELHISGNKLTFTADTLYFIPVGSTYAILPESRVELIKVYFPLTKNNLNDIAINKLLNVNNKPTKELLATYLYKYNKRADFNIKTETLQLIEDFLPFAKRTDIVLKQVQDLRVLDCIQYIENNLTLRFSIADIASSLHINPTYLSVLFKAQVGTSIIKYTNNLRLEHALHDIRSSNLTITQIANKHGFADVRTLNEHFRARYNQTPMDVRNIGKNQQKRKNSGINFSKIIDKYHTCIQLMEMTKLDLICDSRGTLEDYRNSFNCMAIGRAHDILFANVQTQITTAKADLDFKFCRFHNLFGDEMNVIDTDYNGNLSFNFHKPFIVIDFLLTNNIIPFIELGFFPKQIAPNSSSAFTGYNINLGDEINLKLWKELIGNFFTSLIELFPNDYLHMRFDLWNELDISAFWPGTRSQFYELYQITYQVIKSIDPRIKLGGFNYGNFIKDTTEIEEDIDITINSNIKPDFLTIHSYPVYIAGDLTYNPDLAVELLKPTYVKDKLNIDIKKLLVLKNKYKFSEVYITEWNTSPMQREHLNDTSYKSSKIISEILNSKSQLISGICYWTLSDEMAEFGYPLGEVHGGFGLFTRSGIPKPAYYAFTFIAMLQGKVIHKTTNSIITKDNNKYTILLNNDVGYDRNYYLTNFESESQIMEGDILDISIQIDNITAGRYQKTIYNLTSDCDLKANFELLATDNNYLSSTSLQTLHKLSTPSINHELINLTDQYYYATKLKPTASTLIRLELL